MSGESESLSLGCPRCHAPVVQAAGGWHCPEHAAITPLWRPALASYDAFVEHLSLAGTFPTYLPWPLSPGWHVTDFGVVSAGPPHDGVATVIGAAGTSDLDGAVDVMVVSEEPGTGVGARCAGTLGTDPGPEVGDGPPAVRVRIGTRDVSLWVVSTSVGGDEVDRAVVAGEAEGRWLWLVLRPASALLLLRHEWTLRDLSGAGPVLVELPFSGPPPPW